MVALFVVITFLFFIVIDLLVLKAQNKEHPAFKPSYFLTERLVFDFNNISIPHDRFFSKGHTWLKKNDYGLVKIGLDDFINKTLGNFKITKITETGTIIKKGDIIFEGGYKNHNFKFKSPIDGEIKFVNPRLIGRRITDPYNDDWSILILSPSYETEKCGFISGNEIKTWMKKEFKRLHEFLGSHVVRPELAGVTMQDGGNIVEGALSMANDEAIKDFEKEFLSI